MAEPRPGDRNHCLGEPGRAQPSAGPGPGRHILIVLVRNVMLGFGHYNVEHYAFNAEFVQFVHQFPVIVPFKRPAVTVQGEFIDSGNSYLGIGRLIDIFTEKEGVVGSFQR